MNKVTAEEYNLVEDRSRNGLPGPLGAEGGCISIGEVLGLYGELGAESPRP